MNTDKKVSVVQYFSYLLIAAAHHDAVALRNVSLSSSDKPQHSSSTETIIKDDKVTLDCTVKANPAPTYTWDHLKEKNSSSVLQSSTLSPGDYTCTATNTLGRDSKVFIVKSTGGLWLKIWYHFFFKREIAVIIILFIFE